jgi:hypothetical protein
MGINLDQGDFAFSQVSDNNALPVCFWMRRLYGVLHELVVDFIANTFYTIVVCFFCSPFKYKRRGLYISVISLFHALNDAVLQLIEGIYATVSVLDILFISIVYNMIE